MIINIGRHDCTEVWDGVFYKKLSDYPNVTDNEMKDIIDFTAYEKLYGRESRIVCENKDILCYVQNQLENVQRFTNVQRPEKITECTACPTRKGCMTDFVCHTTSVENAEKIFRCGWLLSAVKARGVPVETLMNEDRNAAKDPADFFEYVMFAWGNCQAGDRLVMERKLKRFPDEKDLSENFTPGIRFYFRYDVLDKHPHVCHDGVLPLKIKDGVKLEDYVSQIIIPKSYEEKFCKIVPEKLSAKTVYLENDCADIWEWSEKCYVYVSTHC